MKNNYLVLVKYEVSNDQCEEYSALWKAETPSHALEQVFLSFDEIDKKKIALIEIFEVGNPVVSYFR